MNVEDAQKLKRGDKITWVRADSSNVRTQSKIELIHAHFEYFIKERICVALADKKFTRIKPKNVFKDWITIDQVPPRVIKLYGKQGDKSPCQKCGTMQNNKGGFCTRCRTRVCQECGQKFTPIRMHTTHACSRCQNKAIYKKKPFLDGDDAIYC